MICGLIAPFGRVDSGFKSTDRYLSFKYPQPSAVDKTFAQEGSVYLPKIGFVRMRVHRPFDRANVTQINVKRHADGWMVGIGVNMEAAEAGRTVETAVCIDVGLRTFAALSDETKVDNPRHLRRAEKRLRRAQRQLSRKARGSRNRQKAKRKVANIHQKVARQRKDFLHKQSHRSGT
jgi:putative transposase